MIILGLSRSVLPGLAWIVTLSQDTLGYLSLGWFIWLVFARYDHYGKVCTGDYLEEREEESTFVNMIKAGKVF